MRNQMQDPIDASDGITNKAFGDLRKSRQIKQWNETSDSLITELNQAVDIVYGEKNSKEEIEDTQD